MSFDQTAPIGDLKVYLDNKFMQLFAQSDDRVFYMSREGMRPNVRMYQMESGEWIVSEYSTTPSFANITCENVTKAKIQALKMLGACLVRDAEVFERRGLGNEK